MVEDSGSGLSVSNPGMESHRRTWGPLALNLKTHQSWLGSDSIYLTPTEFRVLTCLMEADGGLVTKRVLEQTVWGAASYDSDERLATHVRRIRKKVGAEMVLTVRGLGYRMAETDHQWQPKVISNPSA
jgi:DNA-binding response OmpR family regulator